MKFFKYAFIMLLATSFFTCNNNEDNGNTDNLILGEWKVTEYVYDGTSTTVVQGIESTANFEGTAMDLDLSIQFSENPNEYSTSGDYSIELTTDIPGFPAVEVPIEGFVGSGTWSMDGDELTLDPEGGDVAIVRIIELTNEVFRMEYDIDRTDVQQGATIIYNISGIYTFER